MSPRRRVRLPVVVVPVAGGFAIVISPAQDAEPPPDAKPRDDERAGQREETTDA